MKKMAFFFIAIIAIVAGAMYFIGLQSSDKPSKYGEMDKTQHMDEIGVVKSSTEESQEPSDTPEPTEQPTAPSVQLDELTIDILAHEVHTQYGVGFDSFIQPVNGRFYVVRLQVESEKRLTQLSIKDWTLALGEETFTPDEEAVTKINQFPLTMIERKIPFELILVFDVTEEQSARTPKTITLSSPNNQVQETVELP